MRAPCELCARDETGREGYIYGKELTVSVTVGSMNNRAEQRDDGLRQDRHANRTRGMLILALVLGSFTDFAQNRASTVRVAHVARPVDVAVVREAASSAVPGPPATTVTRALTLGKCMCNRKTEYNV